MHGAHDSSSFILLHEHSKVFQIIYTNCPGNVFQGNVLSGKRLPGKWLSGKRPLPVYDAPIQVKFGVKDHVIGPLSNAKFPTDLWRALVWDRPQFINWIKFPVVGGHDESIKMKSGSEGHIIDAVLCPKFHVGQWRIVGVVASKIKFLDA